jgi:hypothetical protein
MIPRIAVHDTLTAETRRWSEQMSPGVVRAWRKASFIARRLARESAARMLRRRTGKGAAGITRRVRKTASGVVMEIWPSVGYLAAHELGSTIPAVTIRPKAGQKFVAWQAGGEWRYAAFTRRPAFTLPRRPWATAAAPAAERATVEALEAEMGTVFDVPGFTRRA